MSRTCYSFTLRKLLTAVHGHQNYTKQENSIGCSQVTIFILVSNRTSKVVSLCNVHTVEEIISLLNEVMFVITAVRTYLQLKIITFRDIQHESKREQ